MACGRLLLLGKSSLVVVVTMFAVPAVLAIEPQKEAQATTLVPTVDAGTPKQVADTGGRPQTPARSFKRGDFVRIGAATLDEPRAPLLAILADRSPTSATHGAPTPLAGTSPDSSLVEVPNGLLGIVIQVLPAPSESGKASMARVLIEEGTLNGRQLWISTEELTPASAPGSTYSLEYTEGLRQTLERRRAREREANRSRMLIVGRGAPNMQNSASESGPNASSKSAGVESANAQEPTAPSSVVYPICGALTREGRPCQRRVKGGGFCYQHRDASAEPAPAPKRAKPKL